MLVANRSGGEEGQEGGKIVSNRGISMSEGLKLCLIPEVMVNCVNLTVPQGAQVFWSNAPLGVSVMEILDKIYIRICRLSEADSSPKQDGHHSIS